MPTLYLIDGNSYIYRAFYAIRSLATSSGLPTNAIYGFTAMILKILREKNPDYFAIVFDAPGPTHRHESFQDYKAHRPGMPDELRQQVPLIKDIVNAFRIKSIEKSGYEADDILAMLAKQGESQGLDVYIVTGDKDMCQVVSPLVRLYDTMKEKVTEEKDVMDRYGVPPSRFPEIIALMGDASDNIPGAPGIGEKTAVRLLQEFGSLDAVLQRHEEIKNAKARKAVAENIDNIRLSHALATLHESVPVDVTANDLKPGKPDWRSLRKFFRLCEFSSFMKLVPEEEEAPGPGTNYITVLDRTSLNTLLAAVRDDLTIDTETTSESPMRAALVGISLAHEEGRAYYIPLMHAYPGAPEQLSKEYVIRQLKGVFENPAVRKTGHNIKYDLIVLRSEGIMLRGIHFDTMIASYLLHPNRTNHNLADVSLEYLDIRERSFQKVLGKDRKDFREVSIEEAAHYSGEDAAVTLRLRRSLEPELAREGLDRLFQDIEVPLIEVLADMEMAGIKIDGALMGSFSGKMQEEISGIEQRIYFIAGEQFNINSPKQLQEILFEKLGLRPLKKTKTGYSTNIDVLEQLASEHELPREIIEYRVLSKLKSTYVDALPRMIHPVTGRLHTSFNQTITATGRLSSSEPNLQNIPVRGEWGKRIREAFIAEDGNILISSDYSQIELRILAHMSEDKGLCEAFRQDGDIHSRTACELFNVSPDGVTDDMRRRAKAVNFGIVYGISPYGLSQQLGISTDEARFYIDTYFARHSGVREYLNALIGDASATGYAVTMFGRKRPVPELRSSNRNTRQFGERIATNSPIQGSAADIIKISMINIRKRILEVNYKARLLLQVHDELLLEAPVEEREAVISLVQHEMENAVSLRVPLKADIGTGNNWAEAH